MNNFEFYSPTKIIFGKGTQHEVGAQIKKYASKILLHYGGGSIKKSGLYEQIISSLKENSVQYVELGGVKPNPRLSLIKEGIKICRDNGIKFILAVGGGSVIDSAKAISMGVEYEGDVWDFFERKAPLTKTIPLAAVLTIPAAGSESSPSVVVTNDYAQLKIGFASPLVRPVFSILNPEFCYTLPKVQAANGLCDMTAHIFERYFSDTKNTELSNRLCEGTLKTIIDNAPKVLKDNKDYDAWAEIMFCGNLAHNGLLGMGRLEDWASHAIEHAISAVYDIAHGTGLSIVFPAWMKYVHKHNPQVFARFALNVWGLNGEKDQETLALQAIAKTEDFFKSLGLPTRLSEILSPSDQDLKIMAQKATHLGPVGNFVKLQAQDVYNIYKLAL